MVNGRRGAETIDRFIVGKENDALAQINSLFIGRPARSYCGFASRVFSEARMRPAMAS